MRDLRSFRPYTVSGHTSSTDRRPGRVLPGCLHGSRDPLSSYYPRVAGTGRLPHGSEPVGRSVCARGETESGS